MICLWLLEMEEENVNTVIDALPCLREKAKKKEKNREERVMRAEWHALDLECRGREQGDGGLYKGLVTRVRLHSLPMGCHNASLECADVALEFTPLLPLCP